MDQTNQVCASDGDWVGPVELVGLVDGVSVPVGPVHQVLEHRHAERVLQQTSREQNNPESKPLIKYI